MKWASTRAWRKVRAAVLIRDQWRCQYCGAPATEVDHVVSRMLGGTDHPLNLKACCALCNKLKGAGFLEGNVAGDAPVPNLPPFKQIIR